ncbi:hypothetical protein ATKI12_3855 [Kitasatospora sp. Ki12]
METWQRDPGASGGPRRTAGSPGRLLAQGLLVLAGLATAAFGFGLYLDTHDEAVAHHTAPACGTTAAPPGTDCVRSESGRVTARKTDGAYLLTVARETAPAQTFEVDQDFYQSTAIGADVELRLWHGRVAEVSYHGHSAENPVGTRLPSLGVAALVAAGSALTVRGLTRSRRDTGDARLGAAVVIGPCAYIGSTFLIPWQWPLVLVLGIPCSAGWP